MKTMNEDRIINQQREE